VPKNELKSRREKLVHPPKKYPKGYLDIYARLVASADQGAVMKT
jgi:dihydroxyacid dehydratase/phosphogluconate dehydratase